MGSGSEAGEVADSVRARALAGDGRACRAGGSGVRRTSRAIVEGGGAGVGTDGDNVEAPATIIGARSAEVSGTAFRPRAKSHSATATIARAVPAPASSAARGGLVGIRSVGAVSSDGAGIGVGRGI